MAKRFTGTHPHRIEQRGRVSVPSEFRKVLADLGSEGVYLVPQLLKPEAHVCFSEPAFDRYCELFEEREVTPREQALFDEFVMARARHLVPDDMGRIVVPQDARATIGIDKEVVFVGLGSYFELRAPEVHGRIADAALAEGREVVSGIRMRGLV